MMDGLHRVPKLIINKNDGVSSLASGSGSHAIWFPIIFCLGAWNDNLSLFRVQLEQRASQSNKNKRKRKVIMALRTESAMPALPFLTGCREISTQLPYLIFTHTDTVNNNY